MKFVALFCLLFSLASAEMAYRFADGYVDLYGEEPVEAFTCEDKPYGYYADTANACRIFHICHPVPGPDGDVTNLQFSFFCGNQTVFSQESLTCAYPEDALPCEEAESYFSSSNGDFGKISETRFVAPVPVAAVLAVDEDFTVAPVDED